MTEEPDNSDLRARNDNVRYGRTWPKLSREVIEADLRTMIERWLHLGVPSERINEIVFGLSKDLTYYALEHDPVDPDRAMERYEQVCNQAGVLQILEKHTLAHFVKCQGDKIEREDANKTHS
ncbi:hypothetical protein [Ponticaulis sp.]|uniref:hypothetical protein n=1 Tax=Ponticaulis sp. TaxID=2020902 RepID=UPI000C36AAB8|nr:hypothetical protein [Ponticaulis sp.]MAJ10326.1 hypothetical protein [Ponticaulis sp.]HBH91467.1 hypothetical protein [Hyphomonadaceae bacterium]HBJ94302.1 hypothetical protein [Hyphomonadaceae bacterium]|tara:strand:- start:33 stop:398 length:366 start_codon:yes stop_codon:yes gene_type:complete